MKIESIKKKIKKYEYISFDVFDTLLVRDVLHYTQVFDIVEKIALEKYGIEIKYSDLRIEAEKKARKLKNGEINFDDIFLNFDKIDSETLALLKNCEIEIEKKLLMPNALLKNIYDFCVENNKKIIVTSDIYFNENFIKQILKENGYAKIDYFFISSEIGYQKRNGRLFDYLIDKIKISKKQVIHIGDNIRSDVIIPRLKGIASIHIKNNKKKNGWDEKRLLKKFCENHLCSNDFYYSIGYTSFGPLVVGYIKYMIEYCKLKKIDEILFCARDGYILKRCYEIFCKNKNQNIPFGYFYASRRSLQVPMLSCISQKKFETFFNVASFPPYVSLKDVLMRMGIRDYNGGDEDKKRYELKTIVKKFCGNELQVEKEKILSNSKKEKNNFLKYIESFEICEGKKIAFIDIGWKGSLQYSLEKIISSVYDIDLVGCYLGIHNDSLLNEKNSTGFLFEREKNDNFYAVMGAMSVLEIFFSAPHGSTYSYDNEGNVIFSEYEYGKYELKKEMMVMKSMQEGAIRFVEDFLDSPLTYVINMKKDISFDNLKRLMTSPTKEEIQKIGDIQFDGAAGIDKIINWKGWKKYMRTPKTLIIDYSQSGWKIGFIKRALKTSLSYNLFKFSYNLFKK